MLTRPRKSVPRPKQNQGVDEKGGAHEDAQKRLVEKDGPRAVSAQEIEKVRSNRFGQLLVVDADWRGDVDHRRAVIGIRKQRPDVREFLGSDRLQSEPHLIAIDGRASEHTRLLQYLHRATEPDLRFNSRNRRRTDRKEIPDVEHDRPSRWDNLPNGGRNLLRMQRAICREAVGKEDELRLLRSRIARRADKNLARDALHRRKSAFDEKRDRRADALDRFGIHDAAPMAMRSAG